MSTVEARAEYINPLKPLAQEYTITGELNIRKHLESATRNLAPFVRDNDKVSEILIEELKTADLFPVQIAATMIDRGLDQYPILIGFGEEDRRKFLSRAAVATSEMLSEKSMDEEIEKIINTLQSFNERLMQTVTPTISKETL